MPLLSRQECGYMKLWLKLFFLAAVKVVSANVIDFNELDEVTTPSDAPGPESEFVCIPELGFLREGGIYNEPNELITSTPMECCRLCREDPHCQTWSRHRVTGTCALMNTRPPLTPNELYDSGLLEAVDALEFVEVVPCSIKDGVRYPKGNVLRRRRARNAERCCQLCRENIDCFSWHYKNESRRCVMNGNVPTSVADEEFQGNALY